MRYSGDHPPEERVSSNVSQNYPYTSETERERAATIAGLLAERDGLADAIESGASPLEAGDRWWVWKCPSTGCRGLLHVAGYAIDRHALYVVCDGSCAKTYLR